MYFELHFKLCNVTWSFEHSSIFCFCLNILSKIRESRDHPIYPFTHSSQLYISWQMPIYFGGTSQEIHPCALLYIPLESFSLTSMPNPLGCKLDLLIYTFTLFSTLHPFCYTLPKKCTQCFIRTFTIEIKENFHFLADFFPVHTVQ